MSRLRSGSLIVMIGSILVTWPACGDGLAPSTTGVLDVSVNGFPPGLRRPTANLAVLMGAVSRPFTAYDPSPRLVIGDVPRGDVAVELEGIPVGVPAHCESQDGMERSVTISPGTRTYVFFTLNCTWGTLQISTFTTGAAPDTDGYTVELIQECYYYYYDYDYDCETTTVSVPSQGTVTPKIAATLFPYSYRATLTGVAANCTVPVEQHFTYPEKSAIAFTIACGSGSASRGAAP